jgi:hypothetical protein
MCEVYQHMCTSLLFSNEYEMMLFCVCRLPVALGPAEVYSSVNADTVLTVLTHKITKAVRTQVRGYRTQQCDHSATCRCRCAAVM